MADPWPTELRLDKERRVLTVAFDDGQSFALPEPRSIREIETAEWASQRSIPPFEAKRPSNAAGPSTVVL